jgi:hypothetical protein
MPLVTVKVNDIELDVYYDIEKEKDPYGTGDSPTLYAIDIIAIESGASTQDISSLLADSVIEDIENQLIEIENE